MEVPLQLGAALEAWRSPLTGRDAIMKLHSDAPSLAQETVARLMADLVSWGCVIPWARIASHSCEKKQGSIRWLAIPTSGRVFSLQRAMASYAANLHKFGHTSAVVVADDAADSNVVIEALETLSAAPGTPPLWYMGVDDKNTFARLLAQKGDIPPDAIRFGIFGSGCSSRTVGANRNALLLHTCGENLLTVDDDTICRPNTTENTTDKLTASGHMNPEEAWCFESAAACMTFGASASIDVLGAHETCLGSRVSQIVSCADAKRTLGELRYMCPHMLESLCVGTGNVRVTFNGARGDCGFHSDLGMIAHPGATGERLRRLEVNYHGVLESRQIVRQAPQTTLCHPDSAAVAMFMGLDNSSLLPPFLPGGRNAESVFIRVMALCSDHDFAAHLPFTLDHDPPEGRRYAKGRDTIVRLTDLVGRCASTWRPGTRSSCRKERMVALGRYLRQLGSMPSSDFAMFSRELITARNNSMIEWLSSTRAKANGSCPPWERDISERIEALAASTATRDFHIPVDLPVDSPGPDIAPAQSIVRKYGELLEWWPAITERTSELKSNGVDAGHLVDGRKTESALGSSRKYK